MASIRKHPKSSKWLACFRTADGQQKTKSTGLRAVAQNRIAALRMAEAWKLYSKGAKDMAWLRRQTEQLVKERGEESREPSTVKAFVDGWLAAKRTGVSASTLTFYGIATARFVEPGNRRRGRHRPNPAATPGTTGNP